MFLAGWLVFWLRESFNASQVLVTVNTVIQLVAVAALPPLTPNSHRLLWTTHIVAKTFAGIGILDFLDNGGIATVSERLQDATPSHADHAAGAH